MEVPEPKENFPTLRDTPHGSILLSLPYIEQRTTFLLPFKTVDFSSIYNNINFWVNKMSKTGVASTSMEEPIRNIVHDDDFWGNLKIHEGEEEEALPKRRNKKRSHNPHWDKQGTCGPPRMVSLRWWIACPWGWWRCVIMLKASRGINMSSWRTKRCSFGTWAHFCFPLDSYSFHYTPQSLFAPHNPSKGSKEDGET